MKDLKPRLRALRPALWFFATDVAVYIFSKNGIGNVLGIDKIAFAICTFFGGIFLISGLLPAEGEGIGCIGLITSAPRMARYLFASKDVFEAEDPKLRRLGLARSTLGFFAPVVVTYAFYGNRLGVVLGLENSYLQLVISAYAVYLFGGICSILGILVLAYRQRAAKRRHLLTPLYTYALAWGILLPPVIILTFFHSLPLVYVFAFPWWLIFFVASCFYLIRDVFRAADANPLLAPVVSTMMSLITFLVGLLPFMNNNGISDLVGTAMSASGVLSTGTLAAIEIRSLRSGHGITTRATPPMTENQPSGPPPEKTSPPDDPPPA